MPGHANQSKCLHFDRFGPPQTGSWSSSSKFQGECCDRWKVPQRFKGATKRVELGGSLSGPRPGSLLIHFRTPSVPASSLLLVITLSRAGGEV